MTDQTARERLIGLVSFNEAANAGITPEEAVGAALLEDRGARSKPPLPARTFDPWPRIPVDTSPGSDFHRLDRIAGRAAMAWSLGPDGTYAQGRTLADTIDQAVREALLHLLELGLIDIDSERMNGAPGWPTRREPATNEEA